MTPLPQPLGTGEIRFWRIDQERHYNTWDSGEGSFRVGGRWNSSGVRAVYTSIDPATAAMEVAVHKGFRVLDTMPHYLTSARIPDTSDIYVVQPEDVPNPNWLAPTPHSSGQQSYGNRLLKNHLFILIPSAVSKHSWNLIFDAERATERFDDVMQERFALDSRLQA